MISSLLLTNKIKNKCKVQLNNLGLSIEFDNCLRF